MYPIVKTTMNIWAEATYQYTLGVPIAAGLHINETWKNYKEVSKILGDVKFREKWSQVAEKMATMDETQKREIGQLYTKGGIGLVMVGLALKGLIKKDDDDEWTILGIHFGKSTSKAISHLSLLMPPLYMAEYLHAYKQQEKYNTRHEDNQSNPASVGAKAMIKRAAEENVYGKVTPNFKDAGTRAMASAIPTIGTAGDLIRMNMEHEYDKKDLDDYLKATIGLFTQDIDLKDRIKVKDKYVSEKLHEIDFNFPVIKATDYVKKEYGNKLSHDEQDVLLSKINNYFNRNITKEVLDEIEKEADTFVLKAQINKIPLEPFAKEKFINDRVKEVYKKSLEEALIDSNVKPLKEKTKEDEENREKFLEFKRNFMQEN